MKKLIGLYRPLRDSVALLLLAGLSLFLSCHSSFAANNGLQYQIPTAEYNTLVALYNSTGGSGWTNKTGWLNPAATNWYGVETTGVQYNSGGNVTVTGNVSELLLNNNGLSGSLPASLGNFSQLEEIYFGDNQLSGGIPNSLTTLSQLYFADLSYNGLSGGIPPNVGNLAQLQTLLLQFNQLTGAIPDTFENLTNLIDLELDDNQFTGELPYFAGAVGYLSLTIFDNCLDISPNSQTQTNIYQLVEVDSDYVVYAPQNTDCVPVLYATPPQPPGARGAFQMSYTGAVGTNIVEVSTNLINWVPLATFYNTNGFIQYQDTAATNFPRRFYRVKVP